MTNRHPLYGEMDPKKTAEASRRATEVMGFDPLLGDFRLLMKLRAVHTLGLLVPGVDALISKKQVLAEVITSQMQAGNQADREAWIRHFLGAVQ